MSLLDSDFIKISKIPSPKHSWKDYFREDVPIYEIQNKDGKRIGKVLDGFGDVNSHSSILNPDNSPFIHITIKKKSFWGIKNMRVEDSKRNILGKVKAVGTIKPHFLMENPSGEIILSTKDKKTILDKNGNTIGIFRGPSWITHLRIEHPWELRICNTNFDQLILLGFFFSLFLKDLFERPAGDGSSGA